MDHILVNTHRSTEGAVVSSDEFEITFDTSSPISTSANFAVWVSLPFAMRLGRPIHISGEVSPTVLRNAKRISVIWSLWQPDLFTDIEVSADTISEPDPEHTDRPLMTFSGGLDSTFALSEFVKTTQVKPDVLTVLGMDYRRGDAEKFNKLLAKTADLRSERTGNLITIRSDAASVMRRFGIKPDLGFGFQLASSLFLFDHKYGQFLTAADFADFQECLIGPYGTAASLTHLYSSSTNRMTLLGLSSSKSEKIDFVSNDPLALKSISFCKDYDTRPENCGVCSKCVRTKAIFLAATGRVPDIFVSPGFSENDMESFDLTKPYERVFAYEIMRRARQTNTTGSFKVLQGKLDNPASPSGLKYMLYRLKVLRRARKARKQQSPG